MRAALVCVVTALLVMTAPARAEAPRRVALVIGNETYKSLAPLGNPRLDAGRLAALLDANGFDVVRCDGQRPGCFDLDHDGLEAALETLRKKAAGADLALVFYAGHGMEGHDGNVLAPVDMEVSDCAERALLKAVSLKALFKAMAGAHSKIMILDACRDDPFTQCPPQRGVRRVSFGELTVPEAESYLLVSSTKPGQEALDGPAGGHSPYARALLEWLQRTPELYFPQVLSYVAKGVIEDTARTDRSATQVPEMLQRGEAPDSCLKGEGCVGDVRFAALSQELEGLRKEHARDQEAKAIADDYLAAAEKARAGRPLTEEEKREQLESLKEVSKGVSDFLLEAAKGHGRPFSREDEAQERARLMEAIRALPALGDTRAERALERLKAGDESEAERLFAEAAAARKQAAQTAASRAAEENREAAKALRHLAAITKPKNVAKAADTYKEAAHLDPADAQTWIDYARTALDAGRTAEARAAFEQADIKARASGDLLVRHRAALGLGDVADNGDNRSAAEQHFRAALALAEEAAKADPGNAAQRGQALAHERIGSIAFRNSIHSRGEDLRRNLADAIEHYKTALAISERLAGADAGNPELQKDLIRGHFEVGMAVERQDDFAGALASFQAALGLAERHTKSDPNDGDWLHSVSAVHSALGLVQEQQGNFDAALASQRAALDFSERAARIDPSNTRWQLGLETDHSAMALLLKSHHDYAGALASYQAALVIAERLVNIDPGNVAFQGRLAGEHASIGQVLQAQSDLAGALASYRAALAIHDRRVASDRANVEFQLERAYVHGLIAGALKDRRDLPGALASYRDAIAGYEKADSSRILFQVFLWLAHSYAGSILEEQGDLAGALASYRASLSVAERLAKIDPADDTYQDHIALTHRMIGDVLRKQDNPTDALASYRAALAIDEERLKSKPGDTRRHRNVGHDLFNIAVILRNRNDLAAALSSYKAAVASYREADLDAAATQESLRNTHNHIGYVLLRQGNLEGALASDRAALEFNERLVGADPTNNDRQAALWLSHVIIGDALYDQGHIADALASYTAGQEIAERRSKADPGNSVWQVDLAGSYDRAGWIQLAKGDQVGALALWRKALATAEASAVSVEQDETKSAGKPGKKTAEALRSVGWQALVARDFSKADAAWQRAGALVPELVWPDIGHAHVLLFRNRLREARALYLKNKGKSKFVDGRTWEEGIADDFGELRRAGLTHPMMREVEVALGIAPAQVSRSAATDADRAVLTGEGGATPPPAPPMSSPTPTHEKKRATTPDWRTNVWGR